MKLTELVPEMTSSSYHYHIRNGYLISDLPPASWSWPGNGTVNFELVFLFAKEAAAFHQPNRCTAETR